MQFLALYAVLEFLLTSASHWSIKNEKSETAYFDLNFELYGAVFPCFTCSFGILTYQRFALVSQNSETAYFDFDFAYNLVV